MSDGFITSIKKILLEDSVAANAVGGGRVAGLGVANPDISSPPQGEPGAHRRRKRDAHAHQSRADRNLHTALSSEEHVALDLMDHLSDAGQWRFESKSEGAIEVEPILPNNPKEIESEAKKKLKTPSKLSLKRGADASIALNPVLPHRFEDRITEGLPGGIPRIDYLIRIGLPRQDAVKKINYYRTAIKDPEVAVKNATYRSYVAEVLEKLLQLIFNDAQLYNRLRALLQKDDHPRGENELPEDADDIFERRRFARWKATSEYRTSRQ